MTILSRCHLTRGGAVVALVCTLLLASGCELSPTTYSTVTPDNFYQTEGEFQAAVVPVYNQLGSIANGQYWWDSQIPTDEMILPTRGQDWDDNGVWRRVHRHEWTTTDPASESAWGDAYTGIARANNVLANLENQQTELEGADEFRAELRTLRAFYYYTLMDLFGNIPIVTAAQVDPDNPPATTARAEVFSFIEQELRESLNNLPLERSGSEVGRVTEGTARAILANMYLNAEVFTGEITENGIQGGQAMYQEAIDEADAILESGVYDLADNFFQNFAIDNHTSPETIFAVQFVSEGGPTWDYHFKTLHYNQWPQGCCNGLAALGSSFDTFDDDDVRKDMFLEGPAPDFYSGEQARDRQGNPLVFTKEVPITGATEADGIRPMKWAVDPNDTSGGFQNDYAFFRLAEIYMIKAEVLHRQGQSSEALELINEVRERAFDPPQPLSMADVANEGGMDQVLLNERMREFHSEAKRRQDQIRFDEFTSGTWEFKEASEPYRVVFPVPQSQLNANPNLTQNPGY